VKTGDSYRGKSTGLWLKIGVIKKGMVEFTVERRTLDKSTGEIKVVTNQREAKIGMMPTVLKGYESAKQ
jgi:hypothetical protein